ncbi:MAG: Re/Si-specific NAD(P)(+) transhydrogenase subunit alpha [Alphaproteobacteria bacterium]
MKFAVVCESEKSETRVAASPDTVKKLVALGAQVTVEAGAGAASGFADASFQEDGATIAKTAKAMLGAADVVLCVGRPDATQIGAMKKGALVVGLIDPTGNRAGLEEMAKAGLTIFAMELVPRISRAQAMDVLSSQSNLAGYRAVIDAVAAYGRAVPMMMTAAGTIAPARIFIMGAGVAGLQAIATARRLGGIVSATDVRAVSAEQVESLGATFIMVESDETADAETAGGYAKEMSEDYKRRQAELVATHIAKQDIVITTALIPGRPAPKLISKTMVESMKTGSVIVDLAVERGGNCALAKPGKVVKHKGVSILGYLNVAGRLAADASSLYARNLVAFLTPMIDAEKKTLKIDWQDEIVAGTLIARNGKLVHPILTAGEKK